MRNNILLSLVVGLLTVLLAEGVLRLFGWVPGQFQYNKWVEIVDDLQMQEGFIADENGILKVDTAVFFKAKSLFEQEDDEYQILQKQLVGDIDALVKDHYFLDWSQSTSSKFSERIGEISHSLVKTQFDSLLSFYQLNPVNSDGFYSIPFVSENYGKPKILLLGDSFTWGHSTSHKSGSFSNTLLARDYVVYNTGISGTDVAQYKKIVEVYLDRIKPDLVILNFFIGNDVTYFKRTPLSGVPLMYHTNAGNINSFQDGVQQTTMKAAYDNVLTHLRIPQTTMLNKCLSKTIFGTLIWRLLERRGIVRRDYFEASDKHETLYCNVEIREIQKYCEERNVRFLLSVIPDLKDGVLTGASSVDSLFNQIPYSEPEMAVEMYNQDDGHFNDAGHLEYANYLEKLIQELHLKSDSLKN